MQRYASFTFRAATSLVLPGVFALVACTKEGRTLGPEQPLTPPVGASDKRIGVFQNNLYQVSQGGRYFSWYGCAGCHGSTAPNSHDLAPDLAQHPRAFDAIYAMIADHPRVPVHYRDRIPTEQLWQITAYVRALPATKPELRRRQDLDEAGEPQGAQWAGPVR